MCVKVRDKLRTVAWSYDTTESAILTETCYIWFRNRSVGMTSTCNRVSSVYPRKRVTAAVVFGMSISDTAVMIYFMCIAHHACEINMDCLLVLWQLIGCSGMSEVGHCRLTAFH